MRFTIVLLLVIGLNPLFAQEATSPAVEAVVQQLTGFYQLTPAQALEMKTILAREARNVAQIDVLREQSPNEYLKRMYAVRESTRATTRRLLNENQRLLFQAANQRERTDRNAKYKALQTQGLSGTEIELELTKQYIAAQGW